MSRLTDKQCRFIDEYLVDLNATQAACRAGYSARTARQAGAENLSKLSIASEISARLETMAKRNELSVDAIIQDLKERIEADLIDILDDNGDVLPIGEWPKIWRKGMVTRFRVVEERVNGQVVTRRIISMRFVNRLPLIYLLGRHLGEFR